MTRRLRTIAIALGCSCFGVSYTSAQSQAASGEASASPAAGVVRPRGAERRATSVVADNRRSRRAGEPAAHSGEVEAVPVAQVATPAAAPELEPSQTPASEPAPEPAAKHLAAQSARAPAATAEQLGVLRSDVAQLIDDMVQARSRAAELGKTLFKTRLRLKVQNLAAPDPVLVRIVLTLDGAPVFRGDAAALSGDDARQVFDGLIAPGPHVLLAELEQRSRANAAYGYTLPAVSVVEGVAVGGVGAAALLHDTYRWEALRDKRTELTLIVDDDSDLAEDFPDDAEGEYDVRLKLRVRTKGLDEE